MIRLGIDTSTEWLCLALHDAESDRIVAASSIRAGRRHAAMIMPALTQLLARAGIGTGQLTAIAAGTGPGSYTGLRVGLATAGGLAAGLGVPVTGGDSLQAAAWPRLQPGESAWLTLDARRGNVYAGLYRREGSDLIRLAQPAKLPLAELSEQAVSDGTPVLTAGAPSAAWLARTAGTGGPAEPSYL